MLHGYSKEKKISYTYSKIVGISNKFSKTCVIDKSLIKMY